jgi:hypothetical protein
LGIFLLTKEFQCYFLFPRKEKDMGDLQFKTFINRDGIPVTGNTNRGADILKDKETDTHSEIFSGDIGFVRDTDSLIMDRRNDYSHPSVHPSVAAPSKPLEL